MAEQVPEVGVVGRVQRALLTLLRVAIGWHFLYEGHAKFFSGSWTSAGYLDASRWLLGGAFQWMASHPGVIALVDAVNIGGQIVIGLLLVTGTLTRATSLAAIALLLLYYLANPPLVGLGLAVPSDGHYLVVDRNLIELLTLAVLAALPATFLPGVDRWFLRRRGRALAGAHPPAVLAADLPGPAAPAGAPGRRRLLADLVGLPFLGAFAYALFRKRQWASYEEKNLVDAVTAASTKTLDVASLRELSWMLARGGVVAGMHPEGMRNKSDDPYSFLPAQRGVGKVLHAVDVPVIPVFINGLINDLYRQVKSNFDGTGKKIVVVFGEPVDLSDLRAERASPRVHHAIAKRTLEAIGRLGEEEKQRRRELEDGASK